MLSRVLREIIYQGVPSTITVNGRIFNVAKRYANQYEAEVFPAVTLNYRTISEPKTKNIDRVRRKEDTSVITITYVTGTDIYALDPNYAISISSVTGTVSGSSYTFLSTEYELDTQGPTGFYANIKFLGPNKPDNNTVVTITYKHAWVREWQGGEFVDIISIECWAKDDRQIKPGGDEQFINGMLIVEELVRIYTQWFRYNCDDLSDSFTVDSVTEARDLDSTVEGEEERRRQFDVTVAHVESVEKTKVATIESVDDPAFTIELQ